MVGGGAYRSMKGVMWGGVSIMYYGAYLYDIMWYWPFIWRIKNIYVGYDFF